jgi:hypothetical protein
MLSAGQSDAKTIAQAMRGACQDEVESLYKMMARGQNDAVQQGIRRGLPSLEESSALQVVLQVRKSTNSSTP